MFNETLLPYVESTNKELRKTLFNILQDFEYKNITLELTIPYNGFPADKLFYFVDKLKKNVYIFKINNFNENKIKVNLVSLFKISFEQWLILDVKKLLLNLDL
jgi:hypothetical protein